jgi:hypothetical protein
MALILGTLEFTIVVIPLGFLAPLIVETIAEGGQPFELTMEALTRPILLSSLWRAEEQALGIE